MSPASSADFKQRSHDITVQLIRLDNNQMIEVATEPGTSSFDGSCLVPNTYHPVCVLKR